MPCANSGVDILHVMNPDGTGLRPVSVNNVNEFSPSILPDGRVLLGRWEYVDKTALTIQSLWTLFPDGTNETALYANNLVHPEAVLHARPVPGEPHLIVASLTPHNSPPRGERVQCDHDDRPAREPRGGSLRPEDRLPFAHARQAAAAATPDRAHDPPRPAGHVKRET